MSRQIMLVLITAMVVTVKRSWGLRADHPLHDLVDMVNENGKGPYVGLVMAFPAEEVVLQASGIFVPNSDFPLLELSGRNFHIGTIKGVSVIYVMTGEQVNAGVAVQILYDVFDVVGVIHYGIAGTTNDSLLIGDVSIPNYLAFTSSWDWLGYGSSDEAEGPDLRFEAFDLPSKGENLRFGEFNLPSKGENLLAEVEFTPAQLFSESNGGRMEKVFWLPVDPHWFNISTQLKDIKLQKCLNETECLKEMPKAAFGLRGSTSNVYLNNRAYRRFLFDKLNVSTVDEESASVVMTSLSNGKPCIVFRGISDLAGGGAATDNLSSSSRSLTSLAAVNALKLAVEFIQLIKDNNLVRLREEIHAS